MPQQFVMIIEKPVVPNDGTDEIYNQPKCSTEVFQYLFGVDYPTTGVAFGETVAKVSVAGGTLTLSSQKDRTFNKTGDVIGTTRVYVTAGSWSLFQLLSDKGFKLLDQRNYDTVKHSTNLVGRKLVERVFVRDY